MVSKDICSLESAKRRVACWINSKYNPDTHKWTKSICDICLKELRWPTLELRRQYYAILMLYSILHGLTPLSFNNHFQFNQLPTWSHLLTLTARTSTINAYRYSFYINTPFFWNSTPYDILSLTSVNVFKLLAFLFSM